MVPKPAWTGSSASTLATTEGNAKVEVNGKANLASYKIECAPPKGPDELYFEVMFSFHHCLGDGLSMFAFARTYLSFCDAEHFNAEDLHLETVLLPKEPPPLIDNLVNPYFIEVVPVIVGMAFRYITGKRHKHFKGRKYGPDFHESLSRDQVKDMIGLNSDDQMMLGEVPSMAVSTTQRDDPTGVPRPLTRPRTTNVRFLWFNADFVESLRKKGKSQGTSVASILVVQGLAAVRSTYAAWPRYSEKSLPSRQGWVVTNTIRYMLPNSSLMKGADKETDPSMTLFGGYSGSVMNANLRIVDSHNYWERCRTVRRSIAMSFRASIGRLKLVNYTYRHQSLWRAINKRADLSKLSRGYSVEVANLGAWRDPCVPLDGPDENTRARLDYFAGVVNSSFDGVRGLFTLGVITLGGNMSVSVAYDDTAVSERDADCFVKAFERGLRKVEGMDGKVTVLDARTD
ncbi:hypothetical protein HK104_003307 [Borealophlyctis nickersoniae]|nr:hypothetical protein HK104_003307 [Borealophlyctis nickersoniae]